MARPQKVGKVLHSRLARRLLGLCFACALPPLLLLTLIAFRPLASSPVLQSRFTVPVLLLLWLVLFFGLSQIRRGLLPLIKLRAGTQRLAKQDFSTPVKADSDDEFAELADAFNGMADRLGQQLKVMSAVAAIGEAALSAAGTETIVSSALTWLPEIALADSASVTVLDPAGGMAVSYLLGVGFGQAAPIPHREQNLPAIQNLRQGETQHRQTLSATENSQASALGASVLLDLHRAYGIQNLVWLPMVAEQRLIGVLGLGRRSSSPSDLADEHVKRAKYVADHLAMAIQQTRLRSSLALERQRLARLLEHLPSGVMLLDSQRRILLTNRVARSALTVLGGAKIGDQLEHLGGMAIDELVELASETARAELTVSEPEFRAFEVAAGQLGGEGGRAMVIILHEVTREQEILLKMQNHERLAAVGQLAAGIAHEFNNILQGIVMAGELVGMAGDLPESMTNIADEIVVQGNRGARMIRRILDFSRDTSAAAETTDLAPVVAGICDVLRRVIPKNILFAVDTKPDCCHAQVDSAMLQQMITNIAVNARDAMPEGGEFRISMTSILLTPDQLPLPEMAPGEWIRLTFADTGCGIAAANRKRVFEPFFTTKVSKRTGLGLARVSAIVTQHGGHIDLASAVGVGTTLTVYLPVVDSSESAPQPPETDIPHGAGELIQVVQDDFVLLAGTATALKQLGYEVLTATSCREAVRQYEERGSEIALTLVEAVMPNMGGADLMAVCWRKNPQARGILMSGYYGDDDADCDPAEISARLRKPFSIAQLAVAVNRALLPATPC